MFCILCLSCCARCVLCGVFSVACVYKLCVLYEGMCMCTCSPDLSKLTHVMETVARSIKPLTRVTTMEPGPDVL